MRAITFIGLGEAAQAFCRDQRRKAECVGYDSKIDIIDQSVAKLAEFKLCAVTPLNIEQEAYSQATNIFSLVTANQALKVARIAAQNLQPGCYFFDFNSVAPSTKKEAEQLIISAGGYYIDVAVMAPVYPRQLSVPLLVSGPNASVGLEILAAFGFDNMKHLAGPVGTSSGVKMLRSVMIKGVEALCAECILAASSAGLLDEVLDALGDDFPNKANYHFDRMLIHGLRRAEEMREVVKTLDDVGTGSRMTLATVQWHDELGCLGLSTPPITLGEKLQAMKMAMNLHRDFSEVETRNELNN